jgi:hypothetical protein
MYKSRGFWDDVKTGRWLLIPGGRLALILLLSLVYSSLPVRDDYFPAYLTWSRVLAKPSECFDGTELVIASYTPPRPRLYAAGLSYPTRFTRKAALTPAQNRPSRLCLSPSCSTGTTVSSPTSAFWTRPPPTLSRSSSSRATGCRMGCISRDGRISCFSQTISSFGLCEISRWTCE